MRTAAEILIGVIALLHLYFLVLEMFLWTKPKGLATFSNTAAEAEATKSLAANQGLYNGFLVAGLVWSLLATDPVAYRTGVFFLGCVIVAGVFGAVTAIRKILYIQAMPAVIALVLLIASH